MSKCTIRQQGSSPARNVPAYWTTHRGIDQGVIACPEGLVHVTMFLEERVPRAVFRYVANGRFYIPVVYPCTSRLAAVRMARRLLREALKGATP